MPPKPSRGMPRSLIYAMIPLGFILLVIVMIAVGVWSEDSAPPPPVVEDDLVVPEERRIDPATD
jgi:TRAP-type C4-dicarboxylate transport system permease small subunit